MTTYTIEDAYQPLISAVTSQQPPSVACGSKQPWFKKQRVFPKSKGSLMILLWNIVVGATYATVLTSGSALVFSKGSYPSFHNIMYALLGGFSLIAAGQFLCYPLGGLLADIYCGRGRIIAISTVKLCCGYGVLILLTIFLAKANYKFEDHPYEYVIIGVAVILFTMGFTGFQANAVQFGLDQLLDAPSEELSMFLHWYVWTDCLGRLIMGSLTIALSCSEKILHVVAFSPVVFFVVLTTTLVFSCYKRKWFHSEPRTHNPYGMVYRVLKFVAGHKQPRRRSAFAYCDDEIPTRMDFAKERFGGPFSTETVEDVKTFLRILVMLLAIGPIYILNVAVMSLFPFYGVYMGPTQLKKNSCRYYEWILLDTGNLTHLVSVLLIPPYICFVLPCVRKSWPKILPRLGVGMVLLLLSAVSMTATQMTAHYTSPNKMNVSCLFDTSYQYHNFTTLDLHAWVLVFPNLTNGMAVPLIYITILEFISAQSPHTMKGLLLGAFYAVRGLFTIIGCFLVFPFTNRLWAPQQGKLFDCGVSYYVSSVLLGVIGLAVFGLAARWYQYRERDDIPYGPRFADAWLQRQIQARQKAMAESVRGNGAQLLGNTSILDYGTTVGT